MKPQVGQLLYRGCSCDDFAKVLKVYQDANGMEVIDVELLQPLNELYFPVAQSFEHEEWCLTKIELPPNTPVKIINVEYHSESSINIKLRISTGGCHRCTESFYPHFPGEEIDWDKGKLQAKEHKDE